MATLSVAVMAHPSRRHLVGGLLARLGDVPVVWDTDSDPRKTGRRALELHLQSGREWGLTVQDDAVLCRDFLDGARAVVEKAEGHPVSFYVGQVRPEARLVEMAVTAARERGARLIEMDGPFWGVAMAIPVADIPDLLAYSDANPSSYDGQVCAFYRDRKTPCWYTHPSLVNHREMIANPSLVTKVRPDVPGRVAHEFIGSERSATEVWS